MEEKALFDLTYGLFLIGTKDGEKENGCIVNTVVQVATTPTRISLACINGNLTTESIKNNGYFTVGIIDNTVKFALFKDFGLRHGFDVNKFDNYNVLHDHNGIPYIENNMCSVLSCKVISSQDLGSHTLFIAEVIDAFKLSNNQAVTYSEYHRRIKEKTNVNENKKIVGYRCTICGYEYRGEVLPEEFICPLCNHPASDFEPIYE